jgi:hypothetical protein
MTRDGKSGSRRTRRTKPAKSPGHEALGQQALVMRRRKRYEEALDLYRRPAAASTAGQRAAEANWISKQGQIHRLLEDPVAARKAFETARTMY